MPMNLVPDRCPACGEPTAQLVNGCCALCGHRVEDRDVTSEDCTPYAQAFETGGRAWRLMCGWVYGAGKQRLAHLGLSRPSRASQRFGRINILLFVMAVTLAAFANSGWYEVKRGPGVLATSTSPTGKGWWHSIERPGPRPPRFADRVQVTDLWWNVPLATMTTVGILVVTWLAGIVLLRLVAAGGQRSLGSEHRAIDRLRCAIQYSTAWLHWITAAVLVLAFRPLAMVFDVVGWGVHPSSAFFDVPAVLLALAGTLMWWFWLVRLGDTVPKETRHRVNRFFLVWMPLLVVLVVGGTGFGLWVVMSHLAVALNLIW